MKLLIVLSLHFNDLRLFFVDFVTFVCTISALCDFTARGAK